MKSQCKNSLINTVAVILILELLVDKMYKRRYYGSQCIYSIVKTFILFKYNKQVLIHTTQKVKWHQNYIELIITL